MAAAEALLVLSEPHRREILDLLLVRSRSVGELVSGTGLSQSGTSKHLRVLRDVGLVESRVHGKQRIYKLRAEPLRELDNWLAPYRRLWSASLDRLGAELDRRKGK